jgi:hypothetical protein
MSICVLALMLLSLPVQAAVTPSQSVGLTLQELDPADMEAIEAQLGQRAGVLVAKVVPDSAAAKAGVVQGEIILAIGETLVDSPQSFDKTLSGKTGTVELVSLLITEDEVQLAKRKLTLSAKAEVKAAAPVPPAPAKAATPAKHDTARKGQTYQHVIGFSFWYPEGWSVKEADDGLQLVPANAATANGQPAELYFITGQPLEGTDITQVRDPRVIALLDQLVQEKISPLLQRTRDPLDVSMTNGQGMLLYWNGQGPGGAVQARIYACILKGYGVILGAVAPTAKIGAREGDLKAIFTSFGFEAGKQDPAVVGAWQLFSTRTIRNEDQQKFTSDDPRRASSVSNEQTTMEFRPDGTVVRTSIYRMIAGGGAAGGSSTVWIDTGDQKETKQGKWNAGNGTLFIMWSDGSMDSWRYGLVKEGGAVALKLLSGNQVAFWQKR